MKFSVLLLATVFESDAKQLRQTNQTLSDPRTVPGTDPHALDNFVRSCVVTMSVRQTTMLPTEQLTHFCSQTDAVVECRLQLEGPLMDAHKQGSSTAMTSFCKSAFNWFQSKYGQYCPQQCSKLQCVPTCNWLSIKKDLDSDGEQLDEESEAVSGVSQRLDDLKSTLSDAEKALVEANRSYAQTNLTLERAEANLDEKTTYWNQQENKTESQRSLVDELTTEDDTLTDNVTQQQTTLKRKVFDCDMLQQEEDQLAEEEQQLKDKSTTINGTVNELEAEIQKINSEVDSMKEDITDKTQPVTEITGMLVTVSEKQVAAQAKYDAALEQLDNGTDGSAQEVATLEDLVTQMRERAEAANESKWKMERTLAGFNQTLAHTKEDLARTEAEVEALEAKRNQSKAAREAADNSVFAKGVDWSMKKEETEACLNASATLRTTLESAEATLAVLRKTLSLQSEHLKGHEAQLKKDTATYNTALTDRDEADKKVSRSMEAIAEASAEYAKVEDQVNTTETEYHNEAGDLLERIADHKEEVRMHNREKPEIVRRHGLGFIELFGY